MITWELRTQYDIDLYFKQGNTSGNKNNKVIQANLPTYRQLWEMKLRLTKAYQPHKDFLCQRHRCTVSHKDATSYREQHFLFSLDVVSGEKNEVRRTQKWVIFLSNKQN